MEYHERSNYGLLFKGEKNMKRKHIDITGLNIHSGPWIHTRPARNFQFITANNVSFAITENNYYLDTKKDKIRYKFNDCSNVSYDHLYYVYMEVRPGIFSVLPRTATPDNLPRLLEQYSEVYHKFDYRNNPQVDVWREDLTRKN